MGVVMDIMRKSVNSFDYDNAHVKIGNMGGIISSSDILITYFHSILTVNKFAIKDNNVYAYISGNAIFELKASAFKSSGITFFETNGINMVRCYDNAFQHCSNLEYFISTSCKYLHAYVFYGCSNLNANLCDFSSVQVFAKNGFTSSCLPNTVLKLPSITAIDTYGFQGMPSSVRIEMNSLVYAKAISLGKMSCEIYAPILNELGNDFTNNNVFYLISGSAKLILPLALSTQNGGSPDADLSYAISRGVTIEYL